MSELIIIQTIILTLIAIIGLPMLVVFMTNCFKLYKTKLNFYLDFIDKEKPMKKEKLIQQQLDIYKSLLTNAVFFTIACFSAYGALILNKVESSLINIPFYFGIVFFVLIVVIILLMFSLLNNLKKYVEKD